ncbi:MAG: putative Ig domain-containing protein [Candidatus Poseidoniaceae archaeon]
MLLTYSIVPYLPEGLIFNESTGAISGTPTELSTNTTYTIRIGNTGGMNSTTITIEVIDQVPSSISYSPENVTLTKDTASSDLPLVPTITGPGAITSWELNNTNLPSGISFGGSNGTLYGTATQLWTRTAYKVWANNSGGSVVTYFNLTVNDQVPSGIAYSPENVTLTKNTASSNLPLVPTITGPGIITSWELNNTNLPTGISFGNANGTLYGTATQLWTITAYKVWANNSGGSVEVFFNLTVNDQLPGLSYSVENLTLTKGQSSSSLPLNATLTGPGTITSWAISSTLPSGLSFGTSNGTIWGTPTSMMTFKSYTIWANNSGGSSSATVNITVNYPPDISYSPDWFVLTNNTTMSSTATPTNVGGATLSGIIDSSGNVGGYTSTAIDSFGYKHISYYDRGNGDLKYATDKTGTWVTTSVDTSGSVGEYTSTAIDSNDAIHISYYDSTNADLKYATCSSGCTTASNWDIVSVDTSGSVGEYTSIAIDSNDAIHISYYDSTNADLKYATCSNGCTTASNWDNVSIDTTGNVGGDTSIAIDSNDAIHISYNAGTNADLKYATCSSGCTTASNWDINSVYTTGNVGYYTSIAIGSDDSVHISFWDDSNSDLYYATCSSGCTSSGNWGGDSVDTTGNVGLYTSIAVDSKGALYISYWDYTNDDLKYATCSTSCDQGTSWSNVSVDTTGSIGWETSIAIDSNDAVHISYYDNTNEDLKYFGFDSSSNIFGYSVSPALPTGLSFNISTGEISGTPTELSTNTTYTITARNNGGVNTTTITIEVVDQLPTLSYPLENLILTKGQASTDLPLNATLTGPGTITSWEINATLPSGLNFGTSNGTIWGIPTVLQTTAVTYKIWANNSGGSSSATVTITINDVAPGTFEYNPENNTFTNNTAASIAPTVNNSAGVITSWAINATLPSGLVIGATNGTIYGTPTELWTQKSYMVWANNSGGSSVAYLNITVIDQVPSLSYSPSTLVLTINAQSTELPLNATLTGPGAIVSWEMNATLPSGLSFGTANGTIWGIPTVMQTTAVTYTIWGNNTGGSTSATVTITINDALPGPFEYDPENSTWSNNSLVHLAPHFINHTSGNGSTWLVADIVSGIGGLGPGAYFEALIGDTIYFDADGGSAGRELWAHDTSNQSTWRVADINSGSGSSNPGSGLYTVVDGVLYFSADDNVKGSELWAHNPANSSTWRVADINSNSVFGSLPTVVGGKPTLVGDAFYFSATDGNSGRELWAHDTSNHSTWRVTDINSGSGNTNPGTLMQLLAGDTIYFNADDGSTGIELWAHDTSNRSTWQVADILTNQGNSEPGKYMAVLVEDTIYFDANDGNSGVELWAHSISNTSTWLVADIYGGGSSSYSGEYMALLVGETLYFSAGDGSTGQELWAHDTSNGSTWLVVDIHSTGDSDPGQFMAHVIGDTLYFSADDGNIGEELWAHDTSNHSTWLVEDILGYDSISFVNSGSRPGQHFSIVFDDVIYFSACNGCSTGNELYAYNTSNYTTWLDQEIAAGSASSTPGDGLNILVDDTLYLNAYTVANGRELWAYQPSSINTQTNSGGTILSWAINASLPSGLSFGTNNGTIYGRPTELWTQTSYMVWANNSGGSTVGYLNITVIDHLPSLSYSPNNLVLTRGLQSSDLPLNATLTGLGEITSWEINATLPSGLNFGTNNGTIWGMPTVLQTSAVTYTIWANNSGGSSFATVNITVLEEIANIAYNPSSVTIVRGYDMANVTATKTGGIVVSWEIAPSLPSGLSFDNGTIYGLPLANMSATTYTVYANNSGGSASASLTLTINEPTPNIDYNPDNYTMSNGSSYTITPLLLDEMNNQSGAIIGLPSSWSISPSLPAGLNFSIYNGTIWGTPTVLMNTNQYTITATNTNGSSSTSINITINDVVPMLSYSPENLTLIKGLESIDLPLNATLTGSGIITSWEINSSLPTGLNFGTNNGTIWGIPTVLMNTTTYTIWANNSGGSTSATVNITINDQVPLVSYSPENLTLFNNTVNSNLPLSPTLTGPGVITSWAIHPNLPTGLTFELSNGTIWGTATERLTTTQYTVWANNSGGSSVASLNITVLHEVPMFTYSSYNLTLVNNTAMGVMEATSTGGEITSWLVDPTIPTGLTFNVANGTLSGTPTVVQDMTMYTIWGNNTGGSHAVYINITIYDPIVSLDYNPENQTLTRGQAMTDMAPILSGIVDDWAIEPSLPSGLSFIDGVISGTPTVNMTQTMYTIWANNTGGAALHTINLTINEQIADLDYNPENLTLIRNIAMTTLDPTLAGGNVETWEIQPAVPAGLNFANGVLSGTPTVNMTQTMYTVWANNSGGSASHTLNITILEPIVTLDYNPENITMVRSVAMTTLHPSVSGGNVETWAIHPAIPAGLNFANGVLSGTPTANLSLSMFTIYANTTGGSASHTINITILEPSVILNYNPENQTMTRGVAMVDMIPTTTNGSVETWTITPTLPAGLNFNNGVISGTPTVNMSRQTFTVWANNTGGAAFHTVNLTINEPIVTLDYNPENLTLTRMTPMTDLHPTVTGGNVSQWGIEPNILPGLFFDNGLLYGTPSVNQTTPIMYTIYANTSGGVATHTVNISVLEPLVDFAFNPENQTFTRGEQNIVWEAIWSSTTSGMPQSWAIVPSLPTGLNFNNGSITGSPTVNLTRTQYIVWANNSGGSAWASINMTINEPEPMIDYNPNELVLTRNTTMATLQPNVTGGVVATWEIEPAPPVGLAFLDGVLSGTPGLIQNKTQYTVWANNSGGSMMAYLNITVLDIVPEITYVPYNVTLTNDTSVLDMLPINLGGPPLTWDISPSLSAGLEFNQSTGQLTGTPTEVMAMRLYTVTASNSGGSSTTQINITVLDQVPMIAYVPDEAVLLNDSSVLNLQPILTGGQVTSWSIAPNLSSGLMFDADNGTLYGVATQVQSRTMYTITATNDVGSMTVNVNITVEDLLYNMSLGPLYLLNNTEMVALEPESVVNGSTFEIQPNLPQGLFFGANNGTVWGMPTELMDLTNFTIYANSSLFNDTFLVQIGVLEDTDHDGMPNTLPEDADPRRGLIEDLDDDGDDFTDITELDCVSNPLSSASIPRDLDGDLICNEMDDDIDGDGLNNSVETNTSTYIDANNTGSDSWNADSDGDGICDGPIAPALPEEYCEVGPDAFPNDAAAYLDTDGDGMPDELWGESTTGLIEDVDDDNDNWTDLQEEDCGQTDPKNEFDTPVDSDGDGICDFNEVLSIVYGTGDYELLQGQRNVSLQPIITGMSVDIWVISPALPYGLIFGGDTMARTSNGNGTVYGIPLVPSNLTQYTVTGTNLLTGTQISTTFNLSIDEDYDLDGLPNNNTRLGLLEVDMDDDGDGFNDSFELECGGDPYNRSSVPKIESDGTCYNYRAYEEPPEKDKNPFKPICFPIIFLVLAFILVVPMILTRRQARVGVRAEHVSGTPAIQSGSGTQSDPFVLKAVVIPYNSKGKTEERIRCAEMSPGYEVNVREINVEINKKRFGAVQFGGIQDGTGVLRSNSDGLLMIQFTFDGTLEPSQYGMVYKSELILDEKTYFVWHVETKAKK